MAANEGKNKNLIRNFLLWDVALIDWNIKT